MSKIKNILIFILPVIITIIGAGPVADSQNQSCEQKIIALDNEYLQSVVPLQFKHAILEGKLDEKIFSDSLSDINMYYQAFLYELSLKKIDNSKELKDFLESKLNTIAMMSTFANFIDYLSQEEQLKIDHAQDKNDLVLQKFFAKEREKCQKQITDTIGQNKCRDDYLNDTVPAISSFYDQFRYSSTDPKLRRADLELYKKVLHQNLREYDNFKFPMHLSLEFIKHLEQEEQDSKQVNPSAKYRLNRAKNLFTPYKNKLISKLDAHKSAFVESRYGDLHLLSKRYPGHKLPDSKLPDPVRDNYVFAQLKQNAINAPGKDLDLDAFKNTSVNEIYSHVLLELGCFDQELTPTKKEYSPSIFKMKGPRRCLEKYAKMNREYAPTSDELLKKIYTHQQDFTKKVAASGCTKQLEDLTTKKGKDCLDTVDQELINFAEANVSIAQYLNNFQGAPLKDLPTYTEWDQAMQLAPAWEHMFTSTSQKSSSPVTQTETTEPQDSADTISADILSADTSSLQPLSEAETEAVPAPSEAEAVPAPSEAEAGTDPAQSAAEPAIPITQKAATAQTQIPLKLPAPEPTMIQLYEPPPDYQKSPIQHLVNRKGKRLASGTVTQLSRKYHVTIDPATGRLQFKPRRGVWDLLNGALPNTQLYQNPQRYTSIWVGELSGLNKGTIKRQVMYSELAMQQDHWARQIYDIQRMLWLPYDPYSYANMDLSFKPSDYSDYTKQYIRERGLPYLNEY